MPETVTVKLFTLHRNREGTDFQLPANFTKHWGLLIHFYENGELGYEELIEGFCNDNDNTLEAHHFRYGKKKKMNLRAILDTKKLRCKMKTSFMRFQMKVLLMHSA